MYSISTRTIETFANAPCRRELHAVSHGVDLKLYIKIHEEYLALVDSSPSTATLTYTLQPIGKSCIKSGR
jgi:hypothetical protein